MFACIKAGFCVVPINARLHPEEIRYHLQDCEPAAVVYGQEFGAAIASIRDAIPATPHFISLLANAPWELTVSCPTVISGDNVIAANSGSGVRIVTNSNVRFISIFGNRIGTNFDGASGGRRNPAHRERP